jgi:hypothetical protein
VVDVSFVRVGAAIRLTGLPAPRHPGRQFTLTPGGVRIVVLAYTRGYSRPTPFAPQLTLHPDKQLGHVPDTILTSGANGFGRTSAWGGSGFGCLLCRGFFRRALFGLLFFHNCSLLWYAFQWI